jgi:hypothetical protein
MHARRTQNLLKELRPNSTSLIYIETVQLPSADNAATTRTVRVRDASEYFAIYNFSG